MSISLGKILFLNDCHTTWKQSGILLILYVFLLIRPTKNEKRGEASTTKHPRGSRSSLWYEEHSQVLPDDAAEIVLVPWYPACRLLPARVIRGSRTAIASPPPPPPLPILLSATHVAGVCQFPPHVSTDT